METALCVKWNIKHKFVEVTLPITHVFRKKSNRSDTKEGYQTTCVHKNPRMINNAHT